MVYSIYIFSLPKEKGTPKEFYSSFFTLSFFDIRWAEKLDHFRGFALIITKRHSFLSTKSTHIYKYYPDNNYPSFMSP